MKVRKRKPNKKIAIEGIKKRKERKIRQQRKEAYIRSQNENNWRKGKVRKGKRAGKDRKLGKKISGEERKRLTEKDTKNEKEDINSQREVRKQFIYEREERKKTMEKNENKY